jgi:hypothetical protein
VERGKWGGVENEEPAFFISKIEIKALAHFHVSIFSNYKRVV